MMRRSTLPDPRFRAENAGVHVALPIRICFLVFIFTIPFETVDVFGIVQLVTLAKAVGFLLALMACLQPTVCFRPPPAAFWFFAFYLVVYFLGGLYHVESDELPPGALTLAQNLVLFWIASNILRHPGMIRWTLVVLVATMALLSILALYGGIGMETAVSGRRTALGQDHNYMGFLYGLGIVAVLGLMAGRWRTWMWTAVAIPLLLLFGGHWAATGSRGAMAAILAAVATFAVTGTGWTGRFKMLALGTAGIAVLGLLILRSEVAVRRWEAVREGQTGQRVEITEQCLRMVLAKPVFGWGAKQHLEELAFRQRERFDVMDTHSDVFWALTATGIVGGIPFCIGLLLPLLAAWNGRRSVLGPTVLALTIGMLVMGMTVNFHKRKIAWVIMAAATTMAPVTLVNRRLTTRALTPPAGLAGASLSREPNV